MRARQRGLSLVRRAGLAAARGLPQCEPRGGQGARVHALCAVAAKASSVFAHSMIPIVCVGEMLEQRENGEAEEIVEAQVRGSLADLSKDQLSEVVIAYEPVWAIGTGQTASADDAQAMCCYIRTVVGSIHGPAQTKVRIQYGGSVNGSNAAELMAMEDIDGALVGGASLEAAAFARIVSFQEV